MEHGYQLTGDVVRLMADRGVTLVPTLVVTRCGSFFDELGVPCWMRQRSLGAGDRHMESYRLALKAGVEVMLGSDMPPFWEFEGTNATVPRVGVHDRRRSGPDGGPAGGHDRTSSLARRRRRSGHGEVASEPI